MNKIILKNASGIPTDIAYLARYGISAASLKSASELASKWRVSSTDAVLALGLISEDTLYRALAAELEVPFLPATATAGNDARYPQALTTGILPLAHNELDLHVAIAPNGRAIRALFHHRYPLKGAGIALASPGQLAELAQHHFKNEIAYEAAHGLAQAMPHLSFRDGMSQPQRMTLLGMAALFFAGLMIAPMLVLELSMLLLALIFLTMAVLRLSCALEKLEWTNETSPSPAIDDADLPIYSIIVALYNEAEIIPQLLQALKAIDYPAAKLDIILALEEDDLRTRKAIEDCQPPHHIRILIAPDGKPRTKPRALNIALAQARGSHVVIYDAEDIPDPRQLRQAVAMFRAFPDAACLQAHLVIDNASESFCSCMFAIEYAALFDAVNPGLTAAGLPLPLGGTSNHFRIDILRRIGAWDAWNVTEDADLGIRLARFGYEVKQLQSVTREEAPIGIRAWLAQRSRWMKGWMQVCITHSRNPMATWRELGPTGFMMTSSLMFGTVVGALGMPLFLPVSIWMIIVTFGEAHEWVRALILGFSGAVWISGLLALVVPIIVGLSRRRRLKLLWALPLLPLYMTMLTVATWRGLYDLIVAPSHWNKTSHGISRQRTDIQLRDIS